MRVGGAERGGHLAEERLGLLGAEPPAAGERGGERLAFEQLHHQEKQLAELARVGEELVDAADVGVGDRAGEEHLAPDALPGVGRGAEEDLHRDAARSMRSSAS